MTVVRLAASSVVKPWGRRDLGPWFGDVPAGDEPVGEIWFGFPPGHTADTPELLVKYLFTRERLSIQVHPDDASARAAGHARGKAEAWVVLGAGPGATIGLGLKTAVDRDTLRHRALDGSIEAMLDWKPVTAGDVFYSPPGTIHAIGADLVVVEVQQNLDLTYRLYDYGSPRELHLDAAVAVSNPAPYQAPFTPYDLAPGQRLLVDGPVFRLERWQRSGRYAIDASPQRPAWLVPLAGHGSIDGAELASGGVWFADAPAAIDLAPGFELLLAWPGEAAAGTRLS